MSEIEILRNKNKALAKGKSSKDCTFDELVGVYRQTVSKETDPKKRLEAINAFRCGW